MDPIYLTREQIYRLAGIANDALVGAQIRSTASDNSPVYVDSISFDGVERHFTIDPDGSITDTT